ncbi:MULTISPECIES: cobyrinate a,c-diamide synthase [unclassified Nocardioides]|uniref:cobyrinate a,c-diamide synthase n=1 Tax=unclassified Nocardioides TaxID=2615069 RepID=UPI0009F0AE6D|nr:MULTISPECIES: cobyrinate a,c-diamide synthase [unclassified Nocardioides]GAW49198.1 cobyrinic acid a,c-diamide synthase [Nocardioides sp. PD653-B2]GAW55686.1 cobyrinic acid a,c-diamide synthase [Nocardioides sp. PD653]
MTSLPRFVVAAPATGQGKTTVATGLMAALTRAGHVVSGHKVGPDYIDPGYHALASGRPGRNLDPHLVGEDRIVPLLLHGAAGADVAVVEGVMGLYDGRVGGEGFSSTAHVAALTGSPVVLVIDISRSSRSIGAVVHGMATFDPRVEVAGVILNKAGSPRHAQEVASSIGLPVLGTIGRDDAFAAPSRHLGLVPAAERDEATHALDRLADHVAQTVDLDAVLRIARSAADLSADPWDPVAEVHAPSGARPVVAMAGGRAFTFRYTETEELLRAAGCDVATFDPLTDQALPAGTSGLYLGGGFPEVHALALAANTALREDLRVAVADGIPTVAECAGLLYLCSTVDDAPMVGALAAEARMTPRLTLRYPTATAATDSLLTRADEQVSGHEFHRTHTRPQAGDTPAWTIDGDRVGFATPTLHASYLHTHWAGHPHLAQRFADAVHAATPHIQTASSTSAVRQGRSAPLADPLRHHGDAEAEKGLLDLAVNVYAGPRPSWLDDALRASLDEIGRYPTSARAEQAIATRHGRDATEVLATAGAAEAFTLLARLRAWRAPVVVHPQFTEPHAALELAGHHVVEVRCRAEDGFTLRGKDIPEWADLVVLGNPTNPTGVLHPAATVRGLLRPGRVVVVDEAFMDTVPGEPESLAGEAHPGLVVLRSLTKHWAIPGIRAGYLLADPEVVADLRRHQVPWSVSTTAAAAMVACSSDFASEESVRRAAQIVAWRCGLEDALRARGIPFVESSASFVLAEVGAGVHVALRRLGVAVRRADTFPGLGPSWVRIAVRPEPQTRQLLDALDTLAPQGS